MKTLLKTKKTIIITIILLAIYSFAIVQLNQEQEAIIGTWINTETPQWKRVFSADGKSYDYYNNVLSNTYTYYITNEQSRNGKLTVSFLKLVNLKNTNDIYEYEINTLDSSKFVLEYLGGSRSKLIYFTKE